MIKNSLTPDLQKNYFEESSDGKRQFQPLVMEFHGVVNVESAESNVNSAKFLSFTFRTDNEHFYLIALNALFHLCPLKTLSEYQNILYLP